MQRTVLDLWVGAFVLAGIGALVILAFKVGNMSTYNASDTYRLHAYFTNVGGLKPTASVRSAGVLVGRVSAITLDTERYEAEVTVEIDKRYQFPADLAFKVGNMSTYNASDTYRLHAYFTNVGGLKPTASVRSAGVLVGRVSAITLDTERYEAEVTVEIDKRYQFPADTFANILTSGLLGEQYIGLLPGGDDEMLKDGGQFKKTQSAIVLEDLIGKFMVNQAGGGK